MPRLICLDGDSAGHETTANMLTWTFYELARPENASVLRTLQEEIDREIFSSSDKNTRVQIGPDSAQQLARCTYMDAVCSESLRRHPVIPGIGRAAGQPVTIAGRRFPKGISESTLMAEH